MLGHMAGNPVRNEIWPRINGAICEAWGLNPSEVASIAIHFDPFALPIAIVHLYLNEQVMKLVLEHRPQDD